MSLQDSLIPSKARRKTEQEISELKKDLETEKDKNDKLTKEVQNLNDTLRSLQARSGCTASI